MILWKLGAKDAERSGEEKLTNVGLIKQGKRVRLQVNYIAMTTLFFSGIFVTLPGLFIAYYEMSLQDLMSVAPVYYTTFLIQGIL